MLPGSPQEYKTFQGRNPYNIFVAIFGKSMSSKIYSKFKWPLNMYVMPKMNSPLHSGPCTRSRPNSKTPQVIIRIRKAASKAYVLLIVFNESSLVEGKKIIFASWITIVHNLAKAWQFLYRNLELITYIPSMPRQQLLWNSFSL